MSRLLSVEVRTLGELITATTGFRLPWFQRAYSWRTEQVARLLGDMLEAMAGGNGEEYLLGTLMLAAVPGRDRLAIVDGHQRIMTLTILAAVLRDLEPAGPTRTRLEGFIGVPPEASGGFRLLPQGNIAEFLARYIQKDGGTAIDVDESEESFSDSERCVVEVREYLVSRLEKGRGAKAMRRDLTAFLADRCRVILHIFDCEDYAWRTLNTEESTRLAFIPGAEAKAAILGVLPAAERDAASLAWETCEERIGTAGVGEVLGCIRTLKIRKHSEKPIEFDICKLFELERGGMGFIQNWLKPNTDRFALLRAPVRDGGPWPADVAGSIERLGWIEPAIWMPAALRWIEVRGPDHVQTRAFFRRLDRLAWVMRIAGVDPLRQARRIVDVVNQLDGAARPEDMPSLAIETQLWGDAIENLRAQNFCLKHHAPLVLRRLSALLGRDSGPVDKRHVTVEHMLPRNPDKNRRWWRAFRTPKDVKAHVNRLGNLTFLSNVDNQAAATKDWPAKQAILAGSGFVLSEQAATSGEWDRDAILARSDALIELLLRDWELDSVANA